jgi:hypothetical protein
MITPEKIDDKKIRKVNGGTMLSSRLRDCSSDANQDKEILIMPQEKQLTVN